MNYAFEDYVVYSTSETLPAKKEELKEDTYMIFSGFLTGKEILDYTDQVKAELQELLLGVKDSKNKEILEEYLADGKIDSIEDSYLSAANKLIADSIAYQLSTIPEQKEEYFAFVSNSANIHLLTQDTLEKINFKEDFENDLFKVREYINIPYRIYDKFSLIGMYSYNINQNDVNSFFNNYGKALPKIEWFKKKYPDKWSSAEYKLIGVKEKFTDTLNYFEEARSEFVSVADENGYYFDSKYRKSFIETENANSEVNDPFKVDTAKYKMLSEIPSIFNEIDKEYNSVNKEYNSVDYNAELLAKKILDVIWNYNNALDSQHIYLYKQMSVEVKDFLEQLQRDLEEIATRFYMINRSDDGVNIQRLGNEMHSIKNPFVDV